MPLRVARDTLHSFCCAKAPYACPSLRVSVFLLSLPVSLLFTRLLATNHLPRPIIHPLDSLRRSCASVTYPSSSMSGLHSTSLPLSMISTMLRVANSPCKTL